MRIIVIDTETTGLPTTRGNVINDVEELKKWPYIIQLSFIVFDTNKNKICHEHDFIISIPDNVKISSRSIELHGISRKISNNRGIYINGALDILETCLKDSTVIVAHNLNFDKNILLAEAYRNNHNNLLNALNDTYKINYCTMVHGEPICKIPSKKSYLSTYKYPSLQELHDKLFGKNQIEPKKLHNSMVDIIICLRCFTTIGIQFDIYSNNARFKHLFNKWCSIAH